MDPDSIDVRLFARCEEGDGIAFIAGSQRVTVDRLGKIKKKKTKPYAYVREWRIVPTRALRDAYELEIGSTYYLRGAIGKLLRRIGKTFMFLLLSKDALSMVALEERELQVLMKDGDVWLLSVR